MVVGWSVASIRGGRCDMPSMGRGPRVLPPQAGCMHECSAVRSQLLRRESGSTPPRRTNTYFNCDPLGQKSPILSRVSSFEPRKFILVAHRQVYDRCTQAARGSAGAARGTPCKRPDRLSASGRPVGSGSMHHTSTWCCETCEQAHFLAFGCDITLVTSVPTCVLAVG